MNISSVSFNRDGLSLWQDAYGMIVWYQVYKRRWCDAAHLSENKVLNQRSKD